MFSLIITVIAIALVAILALATLYYGGAAFSQGASRAEAAKILLQGQQLLGASDLYFAANRAWPTSIDDLVNGNYLRQIPNAQASGLSEALAAGNVWTMPIKNNPMFVLATPAADVCAEVNLSASLHKRGVLKHAYTGLVAQCYGPTTGALKTVLRKSLDTPMNDGTDGLPPADILTGIGPTDPTDPDWVVNPTTPPGGNPSTGGGTTPPTTDPLTEIPVYPVPDIPPGEGHGLVVIPDVLNFGMKSLGDAATLPVTVKNLTGRTVVMGWTSDFSMTTGIFTLNNGSCFSVDEYGSQVGITLAPNQTCGMSVAYGAATPGAYLGAFQIVGVIDGGGSADNYPYAMLNVGGAADGGRLALSYAGVPVESSPNGEFDVSALFDIGEEVMAMYPNWGLVAQAPLYKDDGTRVHTVKVTNRSQVPVSITSIKFPDDASGEIVANRCGSSLAPAANCEVDVQFFHWKIGGLLPDAPGLPQSYDQATLQVHYLGVHDADVTAAAPFKFRSFPAQFISNAVDSNQNQVYADNGDQMTVGTTWWDEYTFYNFMRAGKSYSMVQGVPASNGYVESSGCSHVVPQGNTGCKVRMWSTIIGSEVVDSAWAAQKLVTFGMVHDYPLGASAYLSAPANDPPPPQIGGGGGTGGSGGTAVNYIQQAGVNNFEVPVNTPWSNGCSGSASQFNSCAAAATRTGGSYSNCQVIPIEASTSGGPGTWQSRIHCTK